jgi:hypothetical protein
MINTIASSIATIRWIQHDVRERQDIRGGIQDEEGECVCERERERKRMKEREKKKERESERDI